MACTGSCTGGKRAFNETEYCIKLEKSLIPKRHDVQKFILFHLDLGW
jgi:hypothetical protein